MIQCPFCLEEFDPEEIVYEFNWGEISSFLYNKGKLEHEPAIEHRDRSVYVRLQYDWRGRPKLESMSFYINPDLHAAATPIYDHNFNRITTVLSNPGMFDTYVDDDAPDLPFMARIAPMVKNSRKASRSMGDGTNTGCFCPYCECQLKPELMKVKKELRILLAGRPGSGKTVYITQVITALMNGRDAEGVTVEPANQMVLDRYIANRRRISPVSGGDFIQATDPRVIQQPYVFLLKDNRNNAFRLIIQDVAGEDVSNRTKYSKTVRNADLILYFVDPWHIDEIRAEHERRNDSTVEMVRRSIIGNYTDLNGVFSQMMSEVDKRFTLESGQLAGVLLTKGDYLMPDMLASGNQPECQMMLSSINFNDPAEMEMNMSMRSSFIRQCLMEWDSSRPFARDLEKVYDAHNLRYFVASSLGQSTRLKVQVKPRQEDENEKTRIFRDDPDDQFGIGSMAEPEVTVDETEEDDYSGYEHQVLEGPARPQHVIDPILWCMHRKGLDL